MTDTVPLSSAADSPDDGEPSRVADGPGDASSDGQAAVSSDSSDTSGDSPYGKMSPEGRADVVVQLSGAISALQAELGRAVAAVDAAEDHVADGATDVAAWLVMQTGVNRRHARETVRVANALEGLPALRGVFAAGAVSFDQVRPVTRFATTETDVELARQLPGWSAGQAEAMARRLTPKPDDEATTARNRRELHWRADHKAGGFRYRGFLPTDQAATVNAALTDLAEKAGPDAESGSWEPFATRCADALHALAVGDRHPGEDSLAVLHVDAATVAWAAREAAARAATHPAHDPRPATDPWAHAARHPDDTPSAPSAAARHENDDTGTTDPTPGHVSTARSDPADPGPGGPPWTDRQTAAAAATGLRHALPLREPDPPSHHPPPADPPDTPGSVASGSDPPGLGPPDLETSGPDAPPGPAPPFDRLLPPPDEDTPAEAIGDAVPPNGVLDGVAVGRDTVLRYLCDCDIEFSVEGPDGTTVGIGRRSRTFPDWMRRHIEARDTTCRFPGCDRAIRHIHHNRHWTRDKGPTDSPNCTGLCWAHHHLVHEGHWEVTGNADGTITFTSPGGRQVTSRRQPLRPSTRAAAARITGTTLTITPPDIHAPPDLHAPPRAGSG